MIVLCVDALRRDARFLGDNCRGLRLFVQIVLNRSLDVANKRKADSTVAKEIRALRRLAEDCDKQVYNHPYAQKARAMAYALEWSQGQPCNIPSALYRDLARLDVL